MIGESVRRSVNASRVDSENFTAAFTFDRLRDLCKTRNRLPKFAVVGSKFFVLGYLKYRIPPDLFDSVLVDGDQIASVTPDTFERHGQLDSPEPILGKHGTGPGSNCATVKQLSDSSVLLVVGDILHDRWTTIRVGSLNVPRTCGACGFGKQTLGD